MTGSSSLAVCCVGPAAREMWAWTSAPLKMNRNEVPSAEVLAVVSLLNIARTMFGITSTRIALHCA